MRIYSTLLTLLCLLLSSATFAQQKKYTRQEYILKYKDIAIRQMSQNGIPASIILAQACLESGNGNGRLAVEGNNHFGIKCTKEWTGPGIEHDDDAKGECFRKYKDAEESFRDHSDFLRTRQRYAFLFDYGTTDYKNWAHGLKKAGYATNPKYPELLIRIIEDNNLHQYDTADAATSIPAHTDVKVKHPKTEGKTKLPAITRNLYVKNGVMFVIAGANDTFEGIAQDFNISIYNLLKYNDLTERNRIYEGQVLYIESKRDKADKRSTSHIAEEGESMRGISQRYAIKLNKLLRYNNMTAGEDPEAGQKIYLRYRMRE